MTIPFNTYGIHVGTRFTAAAVRNEIAAALKAGQNIIFDFKGVESVSVSFADECFAKLIEVFDYEIIQNKTTCKNTSAFIQSIIDESYQLRLMQLQSA